jgi:flavin reductase (DIM6/NTAB) family NADH-FMN oxidoreductase RutF
MAIDNNLFRQVMGHFPTGVTVVTTNHQGTLGGLTVSSFCSVSLDPPLVLICVDLTSSTLPLIRESKSFAVNMLTDQQEHLSRCFATYSQERLDYFCHCSYHAAATGAPILDNVLAFVDARVVAEYPGGDHAIFLGQVEALGIADQFSFADTADTTISTLVANSSSPTDEPHPLAYYRGQYRHLANHYKKPSLTAYYDEDFE